MASSRMEQPVLLLLQQDPAMASLLAVALATVVLLLVAAVSRGSGRRKRLPPSPWSLPVIGHLHLVRPPVHRTFRDLAARLGPLVHVRLGSTHCVVASSAAVASELIRSHEGKISERPLTAVARQFAYGSDGFAFAPYSPHWRFMKRLCMSELLGPRTVDQLRPIRRAGLVSMLQSVLLASSSSSVVDLTSALIRLSNTSIIRMMASTVPASITDEAQVLVKAVAELVGAFNVEDYIAVCRGWDLQGLGRRAADVHRRFDALMEDMIRHKEEAREARRMRGGGEEPAAENNKKPSTPVTSKDLLDILLDKMEDDMAAEVTLTRKKIKAFFIDVVTAGSDTSAAMVEWMIAELMNHPECLRKVRAEIDAVVGRDRIAGEGDVASLPYLMAAYKETLRLRPAAPIAHRQSTEEMELVAGGGNFTVPAGTAVFINLWAIGRDPAYWESPMEFRPERFMAGGSNEGLDPRGQNFQYLPFGSGRRGCPGMGLALQSVPGVVAALIQCFDWTVVPGNGEAKQPAVIDMEEADGLVCARKHPLLLHASPRLSPFPAVV